MQPPGRDLARVVTWSLMPALLAATFASDVGRKDGTGSSTGLSDLLMIVAMVACWLVGVVVTGRAPEQRAGWAFLGLGTAMAWSAFCDDYSELGRVGDRDVPAWRLFATLGDTSFVWWFVFLALVLLYTPPGLRQGMARWLPTVTVVSAVVFQVMALLRSTPLDRPREELSSPLAVPAVRAAAELVGAVAIYAVAACLLASVALLVRAWRRSEGEPRRQLLWLVAGALPLAPAVIAAFALSIADHTEVAAVVLGGAMVALVVGAGLSVLRYRLYDVERVVTESAAYAVASAAVIVVYVVVVVVLSRSGPVDAGSQLATVAATLAGVGVARASYVWGGRAVGRRVNPARFHAVEVVRAGLTHPSADLDELVAQALGDGARVVYPVAGGGWVTSNGRTVEPSAEVCRYAGTRNLSPDGVRPARKRTRSRGRGRCEAAAEMDNVALRAELARQVELIRESRARLSTAHLEERRRIERDLHDGAQQRLLAIALQLQSARINGDSAMLVAEADRAIAELQATVQELRPSRTGCSPRPSPAVVCSPPWPTSPPGPDGFHLDVVDQRFPPTSRARPGSWSPRP